MSKDPLCIGQELNVLGIRWKRYCENSSNFCTAQYCTVCLRNLKYITRLLGSSLLMIVVIDLTVDLKIYTNNAGKSVHVCILTLAANLLRWNLACWMPLVSPRQDFARCQNRDSRPLKSFDMTQRLCSRLEKICIKLTWKAKSVSLANQSEPAGSECNFFFAHCRYLVRA